MKDPMFTFLLTLTTPSLLLNTALATALPRRDNTEIIEGLNGFKPLPVTWASCGSGVPKSIDCATMKVPLDWADPTGEKITLTMNRLKATGNGTSRIGNMFLNVGGPGGIDTTAVLAIEGGSYPVSPELREAFNIIGLDPRGIGLSSPVKCDIDLWNKRVSLLPKTEAEFDQLVEYNKALGESCLKLSGNLVRHIDTMSVARDFETARIALGSEKFNYLGFSYGTLLGTTYAKLFPDNIRVMALDGCVDHSQSETTGVATEVHTYESDFERFAEWCTGSKDCALKGKDVLQLFDQLVEKANKNSIPAPGCKGQCRKEVTGEDIRFNTEPLLTIKPTTWEYLGLGIAQALEGNATILSTTLAIPGQTETNTVQFAYIAVGCLDWTTSSTSVHDILYKDQLLKSIAPHTYYGSQLYETQLRCLGWPAAVQYPPQYANVTTKTPILLVNALYDPETSYTWAVGLQQQIENSVLLTRNGDGHTSYVLGGEATDVINKYLIHEILPAPNTVVNS